MREETTIDFTNDDQPRDNDNYEDLRRPSMRNAPGLEQLVVAAAQAENPNRREISSSAQSKLSQGQQLEAKIGNKIEEQKHPDELDKEGFEFDAQD